MNQYDKILNLCVSDDELRPMLHQPCRRNGQIISTNGHVAVFISDHLPDSEYVERFGIDCNGKEFYGALKDVEQFAADNGITIGEKNLTTIIKYPNAEKCLSDALESPCNPAMMFDIAAVELALSKHDSKIKYAKLPCTNKKCQQGSIVCPECEHETECSTCDGYGYNPNKSKPIGKSYFGDAQVKVGNHFFAADYVDNVLAEIMRLTSECAEILAQDKEREDDGQYKPTIFKIGEVIFMFMPCRRTTNESFDAIKKDAIVALTDEMPV